MSTSREVLLDTIRGAVIGDDQVLDGPFGPRRVTYADYTASGRAVTFIEDYIRRERVIDNAWPADPALASVLRHQLESLRPSTVRRSGYCWARGSRPHARCGALDPRTR